MHARILIAEHHDSMRRALRAVIAERVTWTVCGDAATADETLAMAAEQLPDIVLLDTGLPGRSSLDLARELSRGAPGLKVLAMSIHESAVLADRFREAGARGYFLKVDAGIVLADAIVALLAGLTFFRDRMQDIDLQAGEHDPSSGQERSRLTPREREVLQWLAEGKSNKEIGVTLGITIKTVETHRARIMSKLDLHSMNELVRYAIRNRLIDA